jgi:hypothetical protein
VCSFSFLFFTHTLSSMYYYIYALMSRKAWELLINISLMCWCVCVFLHMCTKTHRLKKNIYIFILHRSFEVIKCEAIPSADLGGSSKYSNEKYIKYLLCCVCVCCVLLHTHTHMQATYICLLFKDWSLEKGSTATSLVYGWISSKYIKKKKKKLLLLLKKEVFYCTKEKQVF